MRKFTVRKTLKDCSNLITHLFKTLDDELSCGAPLHPLLSSSGKLFDWNDSSTVTFSSFSCKIVAWTEWNFLLKPNFKLTTNQNPHFKISSMQKFDNKYYQIDSLPIQYTWKIYNKHNLIQIQSNYLTK